MAKIRRVYDDTLKPDGTRLTIYPITSTRAVYTPESVSLNTILGEGYRFGGVVGPLDTPDVVDQRVWYLAPSAGTYTAFGGIVVAAGTAAAIYWDGTEWTSKSFTIGSDIDAATLRSWGFVDGVSVNGTSATITDGKAAVSISIPTKVSDLQNDSGFLTSESDPVFGASAAKNITTSNISTWNGKQDALVSGTNIKTINGDSILGSGNLTVSGGGGASALGDLSDVNLSSPANGQLLAYDSASSKWVNAAIGNMAYEKLTATQYASRQSAGTLLSTVLYIIVD